MSEEWLHYGTYALFVFAFLKGGYAFGYQRGFVAGWDAGYRDGRYWYRASRDAIDDGVELKEKGK